MVQRFEVLLAKRAGAVALAVPLQQSGDHGFVVELRVFDEFDAVGFLQPVLDAHFFAIHHGGEDAACVVLAFLYGVIEDCCATGEDLRGAV